MKWFKHSCNGHKGKVVQRLADRFGKAQGYGLYFLFVEFFAGKWDGNTEPVFRIRAKELSNFLEISPKKLQDFAKIFSESENNLMHKTGNFYEIKFDKLSESLHRDAIPAGLRPARIRPKTGPNRIEENRTDGGVNEDSVNAKNQAQNNAQQCDLSFSEFAAYLRQWFESLKMNQMKKFVPAICQHFENQSAWDRWLNDLQTTPKWKSFPDDGARNRYFQAALKSEIREG